MTQILQISRCYESVPGQNIRLAGCTVSAKQTILLPLGDTVNMHTILSYFYKYCSYFYKNCSYFYKYCWYFYIFFLHISIIASIFDMIVHKSIYLKFVLKFGIFGMFFSTIAQFQFLIYWQDFSISSLFLPNSSQE